MKNRKKNNPNDTTPEDEAIGRLLVQARERKGKKQKDVVESGPWDQQRVSHYEKGRRAMTVTDLQIYASVIGASAAEVLDPGMAFEDRARFTEEEINLMSLYAKACPEARDVAASILKQPFPLARHLSTVYWSAKETIEDGTIRGGSKKDFVIPKDDKGEIHG